MKQSLILIYFILFTFSVLLGQDSQVIPIHDIPNLTIRDVIIENVDNQGTKEVLVSFRDTGLVMVYNLETGQSFFQKTENNLGVEDGSLAVVDFSDDGQKELIIGNGDITLLQPCTTNPFCFEANSQRIIGDLYEGAGLLPTLDEQGNFVLLGTSAFHTYQYEKQEEGLNLANWRPLFGGMQYRKQYFPTCADGDSRAMMRELFTLEAGNFWLSLEEASFCSSDAVNCSVFFNQPYMGGIPSWDYTFLFFGDADLDGTTDILYGKNDTIFSGCDNNPVFFTGKELPIQSWFFDFDADEDVDILSLELTADTSYNVIFYEQIAADSFHSTLIDSNIIARPDFREVREYFDYPAYLIIEDLNQDGIKDAVVYGASAVKWYNFAPKEVISNVAEEIGETDLRLFPNPTSDSFVIQTDYELISVQLYDLQGRLMKTYTPAAAYTLPVEKGIYLLQVELLNPKTDSKLNGYRQIVKN